MSDPVSYKIYRQNAWKANNGLEMQYSLRLRAQYGHVTFIGHKSIFNRHNRFLSSSPRVF